MKFPYFARYFGAPDDQSGNKGVPVAVFGVYPASFRREFLPFMKNK